SLRDLDFAALLRVLDQNWLELSSALSLPKEARNWVKELQTVRNKWAHQSAQDVPPSEMYRDADTLERVLTIVGATREVLSLVEATKTEALTQLSGDKHSQPTHQAVASAQEQAMQKTDAAQCLKAEAAFCKDFHTDGKVVVLEPKQHDAHQQQRYKTVEGMDRKFAVRPVMRWPPQPRAPTLADAKHLFDLCLMAVGHHHAWIAEFLAVRKEHRFAKVVMLDVPFFPRIPLPTE